MRFAVPDVSGRLREIGVEGRPVDAGSMRADRRREVFRTGRHTHFPLPGRAGNSVGIFPLETEDGVLGVVEVMASTSTLVPCRTTAFCVDSASVKLAAGCGLVPGSAPWPVGLAGVPLSEPPPPQAASAVTRARAAACSDLRVSWCRYMIGFLWVVGCLWVAEQRGEL